MNNVKILWIVMLLAGLAVNPGRAENNAAPGADDSARSMHRKGSQERQGKLAMELGLSADKAKEIKNMMHATRKTMIKLKADRDLAKADLEHLLTADTLDEKAIMAATDKLAQVNAEMTIAQVKARLAISATLTPEQRARMHELRQGMMQRFKERRAGDRDQRKRRMEKRKDRSEDEPGGMPLLSEDKAF